MISRNFYLKCLEPVYVTGRFKLSRRLIFTNWRILINSAFIKSTLSQQKQIYIFLGYFYFSFHDVSSWCVRNVRSLPSDWFPPVACHQIKKRCRDKETSPPCWRIPSSPWREKKDLCFQTVRTNRKRRKAAGNPRPGSRVQQRSAALASGSRSCSASTRSRRRPRRGGPWRPYRPGRTSSRHSDTGGSE